MGLHIRDLELVAAVVERGSLTRAAGDLFVTQSALSHQLRKLERRFGTPLFQRLGRRLAPTAAGERLYEAARAALAEVRRAEEDVRRIASGRSAVVRVSTECYTVYHWLPPVLVALRERFPAVDVRIVAEATRRPVPALLAGKLDLAIVSREVRDRRLRAFPLFADELVAVTSPEHPIARKGVAEPADFADEHVLIYDVPDRDSDLLERVLRPAGVVPARVSKFQLTEALLELVKAGHGVSALANWAVAPLATSGAVAATPLRNGIRREWQAVTTRYRTTPAHVVEFARALAAHFASPEPTAGGAAGPLRLPPAA